MINNQTAANISAILAAGVTLGLYVYAGQTLWTLCPLDILSENLKKYIF